MMKRDSQEINAIWLHGKIVPIVSTRIVLLR